VVWMFSGLVRVTFWMGKVGIGGTFKRLSKFGRRSASEKDQKATIP
jgi:hypothetical protein